MKRSLVFLFFSATLVSMAYAQHAMVDDKELMTKLKDAFAHAVHARCQPAYEAID
ncbi:hypothetical protein [Reyranella soli]|uniref:hypothetical protein n=1 Tax=Reyranella soli TaxID=1230389 RepID=UPI001478FD63|nr:hypothetical protein [Reyranella soli]